MASDQTRGKHTAEFKIEAVRQAKAVQAISVVSKVFNIPKASLSNWVRQGRQGSLSGAGDKPSVFVTPEQMELARLRTEVARLRMERDIVKKPRRTSRRTRCEVRLDHPMKNRWPVSIACEALEVRN